MVIVGVIVQIPEKILWMLATESIIGFNPLEDLLIIVIVYGGPVLALIDGILSMSSKKA